MEPTDTKTQDTKDLVQEVNRETGGVVIHHVHNGIDAPKIDIGDIKRFPSNPADGDTVTFNSDTNQWEATTNNSFSLLGSGTFNSTATTDTFTASAVTDRITSTSAHNLQNGDKIYFTSSGTLPAGLSTGTAYYVKNASSTDFLVAQSLPFDTTVDITDAGTGTHTWTNAKGSINVSFTAKNNLKIIFNAVTVTGASTMGFVFNSDGGANYGYSASRNGAAAGIQSATKSVLISGGATFSSDLYCSIDVISPTVYAKKGTFLTGASGGTTFGDITQGAFLWNNTADQVTKITVYLGNSFDNAFTTGSIVYIYGSN